MDKGQRQQLMAQIHAVRLLQRDLPLPPVLLAAAKGGYSGHAEEPLALQEQLVKDAVSHHMRTAGTAQVPASRPEPWAGPQKSLDEEVMDRSEPPQPT